MIRLELSSTFNLVYKDRLFLKLQKLGIGDDVIFWINSFLVNRTRHVKNEILYSPRKIEIETPQGSSLSPLLFLCLWLVDIKHEMGDEDKKFYHFADDTNLVDIIGTEENAKKKIKSLWVN